MKKTIQRIMALALCLMMCLSALPMEARAAGAIAINETNFPDEVFRFYVKRYCDKDKNGILSSEEISDVTSIDLNRNYDFSEVADLRGIEFFSSLEQLYCYNKPLSSLDISRNYELKELYCNSNQLTNLDLSNNLKLTILVCDFNCLKTLNLSKNPALSYLECDNNALTMLDLSQSKALAYLSCSENQLRTLNVANNPNLKEISCFSNQLTSLDLSGTQALEYLYCEFNKLTALNISKCTKLRSLSCEENSIKLLDIRKNPRLIEVFCNGTRSYDSIDDIICYRLDDDELHVDVETVIDDGENHTPVIISQPKSQSVPVGQTATFKVVASGISLTYQWYRDRGHGWAPTTDTGPEITVEEVDGFFDGCKYRCKIFYPGGSILTDVATLTVIYEPKITTQPKAAKVKAGKKVTFKVKATGGNLTYQWYRQKPGTKKWEKISKATKATYSFKAAKKWNGYKFRCLVKNAAGKTYTKTVKLTVKK